MRQHKVFLRHELLKYNSEKSTAKSSALENYISSANLSLSGCSSAEPDSVSVGACKFQMKKLYLQTVKKVDHLPEDKEERIVIVPNDVQELLNQNEKAKEFYDKMSYTYKKEYIHWIDDAKKEETRERRKVKMIEMLLTGKKGI